MKFFVTTGLAAGALMFAAGAIAASPAPAAAPSWMAGSWVSREGKRTVEEVWLEPVGEAMAGIGRTSREGAKPTIEFMTITREAEGLTFTAIVAGQTPTRFVSNSTEPDAVVFENKTHDFPQRVIYRRCGPDLCARIEGVVNGELKGQDWRYVRAAK